MAIGCTEFSAELVSTTNATSYAMTGATPSANSTLVVFVAATDCTLATPTMSGGGLTWNLKSSQNYNTTNTIYCFWANTGSSPGSTAPTFDCTGDAASGVVMFGFEFTGSDVVTADPIKQVAKTNATSTNPTVTFGTNLDTNNGYCYMTGDARSSPNITPPASWTEICDGGYGTPAAGASGAFRAGGETGTSVATTASSHAWGMMAVEVYVSGAGPGGGGGGVPRVMHQYRQRRI